jgi:hypothetical protein
VSGRGRSRAISTTPLPIPRQIFRCGPRPGLTEAEQIVDRVSVDGTLGFILFTSLFFGWTSGVLHLLVRR